MSFGKSLNMEIENLRSVAFGDINDTFDPLGAVFANPIRIMKLLNNTNALLIFSDDGVNDKEVLPIGGSFVIDITANKNIEANSFYVGKNKQISVRHLTGAAPTSGTVYISAYYGRN